MAANTPDYKFIINIGDVVDHGDVESEWTAWYQTTTSVFGDLGQDQTPPRYMAAPGNHDATETSAGLVNWNKYLPGQVDQFGNEGKFFVFDYMNARFIIMDSDKSSMTGSQYDMLLSAVQENPMTWLFALWHHPIFDFGDKQYEDDIHDTWGIPLYQGGCDILFMGHAHYYVRTKKLALNGEKHPPIDLEKGTVQVVTGNGGAPIDVPVPDFDGNRYMAEGYGTNVSHYGYTELTVGQDTLYLKHYLRDGTVLDEAFYTPNPKTGTSVKEFGEDIMPEAFQLFQNYPNPFNPTTQIKYEIYEDSRVELTICDVKGQHIETLVDAYQQRGTYQVDWTVNRSNGSRLPNGLYTSRLKSDNTVQIRKMVLVK